jgi:Fe-S-cluster-containing dehydrogenase component
MTQDRRQFIKSLGLAGLGGTLPSASLAKHPTANHDEDLGVLVDSTYCVGCRKCEWACRESNQMANLAIEDYANAATLPAPRRPDAGLHTVVNAYPGPGGGDPRYVKFQCMHCLEPACASACIVGALRKDAAGPVSYDADKCIGCRYCMVACPFQIPTYEYEEPLTPRIMKCTFCFEQTVAAGARPACVSICPEGCLIFGGRADLLAYARRRMAKDPDRYYDHIYGEHEAGGTSWLYLAGAPMTELGLPALESVAPGHYTERVQHAVFKNFFPPLALYGLLGGIMWLNRRGAGDE